MELPFTQDAFFAVFGRYNTAVWPLIPVFYLLGAASVALLFRPSRAELAAILASANAPTNPMETNENSPLDGDSSLGILALRRRRRRQVQNRVGDEA